ncbi:MAG: hypothetical protein LBU23_09260 [Planctomycetota bacterium]|nr:hypothetical protein [Planctomycetota bacterium]
MKEHAANAIIPHREILNALRARDADLAQMFVRRHLEKVLVDKETVIKGRDSAKGQAQAGVLPWASSSEVGA